MSEKGFVYVMTNPSMPGLVKVGMTKKVPTERVKDDDLNLTGIPTPFVVQYYAFFDDMIRAETLAHKNLANYHHSKEFFKTDVGTAIYAIESTGIPFQKLHSKPEDKRRAAEIRDREEEARKQQEIQEKESAKRRRIEEQKHKDREKFEKEESRWRNIGLVLIILCVLLVLYDPDALPLVFVVVIGAIGGLIVVIISFICSYFKNR